MTDVIKYRYLVSSDDSQIKFRVVGEASTLDEFYSNLTSSFSQSLQNYVVHVYDAEFDDYVRLDSISQLSSGTGKIRLISKPSSRLTYTTQNVDWRSPPPVLFNNPTCRDIWSSQECDSQSSSRSSGTITSPAVLPWPIPISRRYGQELQWPEFPPQLLADVEDLGYVFSPTPGQGLSPLLSTKLRSTLAEQGYRMVGTHSGVRLSRWTKSSLRGRGACFKRTFYGIRSYETLEMTPSLACGNKCVFCWKHAGTPVTSQWIWQSDDPKYIAEEVINAHLIMINTMSDVQGVKPNRLLDAQKVRYCEFSLVGEPLLYPYINQLIGEMHKRLICTLLYTNGMFPQQLANLCNVTQLVLTVAAPTPQTMKSIERPIFDDYWERFQASLDIIATKSFRTVLRLVLIKQWNDSHFDDYARIINRAKPDFVEIKSVIYCGKTESLTLDDNVPKHDELLNFARALCMKNELSSMYALSCEHEHSSCVLLSHRKYYIQGRWHTWLDYGKFHIMSNRPVIKAEDYSVVTPEWSLVGSSHMGMDPEETCHRRKRKSKPNNNNSSEFNSNLNTNDCNISY
eukprot:NODE_1472_length_1939_cov_59.413546_g1248_i0.p1 GENE.NODE_1472_length_1939_cov_59.413546_g1248_i0~~NODE_1472_length_1939_cov_59.413546_g1248_i0.p1  ORF type:complete len:569 (+),score=90.16 NODE_1472_length_1939_cov_59.413546_g1248_i0:61-1767(+)